MESQPQQPESTNINTPETKVGLESAPMTTFSPTTRSVQKGQWIVTQIVVFLLNLIKNLGKLWDEYKQSLISLALILAAIVALRVVLVVMDALNDIPLLAPTFKIIGLSYCVWFVNRYLLQESKRQELYQKIQGLLNQE